MPKIVTILLFVVFAFDCYAQDKIIFSLNPNPKDTFFYEESYKAETSQNINGNVNKVSNEINSNYY